MKEFNLEPAISKYQEKSYSLEPDMLTGWRSRLKLFKQIPLRYNYQLADRIVRQYTKLGAPKEYRIMYLGARPHSNLVAMRRYASRQYDQFLKESFVYGSNKFHKFNYRYLKQKEQNFERFHQSRIFTGMNPTIQTQQLVFDSDFQCGNLDLVMKVADNNYDIFTRVDSNTRGHTCWFFFRVKNTSVGLPITFNICNLTKKNLLYRKGMKPYIFSKLQNKGWKQDCLEVTFQKKKLRYQICQDMMRQYYALSFKYQFQFPFDQVYFAYCIPYSYSFLLQNVDILKRQYPSIVFLKAQQQFQSPGGLKIPVLTITNTGEKNKKLIFATGRIHPGETQGSWAMNGFLKYLCSDENKSLRDNYIFKIIPMLNVDGVVLGNFRTGLKGADLNRAFRPGVTHIQVDTLKELIEAYKQRIVMYLDFHGHSTKKSAFIYGPQYPLTNSNYILSRLVPKMIGKITEIFRYYGCIFRISKQKLTTARASLFRQYKIPFCYTIQASAHSFASSKGEIIFNRESYQILGVSVAKSVNNFLDMLLRMELRREQRRRQKKLKIQSKLNPMTILNQQNNIYQQDYEDTSIPGIIVNKRQSQLESKPQLSETTKTKTASRKFSQPFKQKKIKNLTEAKNLEDQQQDPLILGLIKQINTQMQLQIPQDSENSSDCQESLQDYTKQEQQQFFGLGNPVILPKSIEIKIPQNKVQIKQQLKAENNTNKIVQILTKPKKETIQRVTFTTKRQLKNQSVRLQPQIDKDKQPKMIVAASVPKKNLLSDQSFPQITNFQQQQSLRKISASKKPRLNPLNRTKIEIQQIKKQSQNVVISKQNGIINIRMDTNEQSDQRQRWNKKKSRSRSHLPEIYRKNDFQKKRLQIIKTQKLEIPNIVTEILKNHIKKKQQNKTPRFNNSIQVVRL